MNVNELRMIVVLAAVALVACSGGREDRGPVGGGGGGEVDAGGGGGTADAGPAACESDFALGETFYHGEDLGTACSPHNAPQNCRTGDFIMFDDTGECICIAACSRFTDVRLGDACTMDGSWTCQHIQATNGNNGEYCVPNAWNLCTR